jgi:rubredoxin
MHAQRHERQRNRTASIRRSNGGGALRPYGGDYAKQAAEVRATTHVCWLCGEGWRANDPWQADHVDPGNPFSQLLGAHRSCNIGRANKGRSKRGK